MNDFKRLMKNLNIDINEIEVNEPEIVQPETNVDRFYKWLKMCGNVHLCDNDQVTNAFNLIK